MKKILILIVGMLLPLQIVNAERVIFVGDSITGQAENSSDGFAKKMRTALSSEGINDVEIVCLGGSGQGVASWINVVNNSKTSESMVLDVPSVYVKEEFDEGADTIVIFLGMNDILAPYTNINGMDQWEQSYQNLIDALKDRTSFTNLILAAPTMCTENPSSYRNKLADKMTVSIHTLATNNNATVAYSRDVFMQHWKWLRMNNPSGRITGDYVHPNKIGHTAITIAMLNALEYQDAAQNLFDTVGVSDIGDKGISEPGIFLYLDNTSDTPDVLKIKGGIANIVPDDWNITLPSTLELVNLEEDGDSFTFTINGTVSDLQGTITVSVSEGNTNVSQDISIYAPWLVCSDISTTAWFNAGEYEESEHVTTIDEAVLAGTSIVDAKDNNDDLYDWKIYYPSFDVTGGDNPNSVDFSTFSNCRAFEMGYMARNIYSAKDGTASLDMSSIIFAGTINYTLYWNGELVYSAVTRNDSVEVDVNEGLNILVVKSCHVTWQWQNSVGVTPLSGITADDLSYDFPTPSGTIVPPPVEFTVTDNNLSSTSIGTGVLTAGPNTGILSFETKPGQLTGVSADVMSTKTGYDVSDYTIDGVSTLATVATNTSNFISYKRIRTGGAVYPLTPHMYTFTVPASTETMYYQLGVGAFNFHKLANYKWVASNLTSYIPSDSDGGNLVPNASFENTSINFFNGGTFVSTNVAKQGSMVLHKAGASATYIAIPVQPEYEITYSIWWASPDIGYGHMMQYGFSVPPDGWTVGEGNIAVGRSQGNGNKPFIEYSGTVTPAAGQDTFYIGVMCNGGFSWLDSIFVAQLGYPEPSGASLLVIQ